MRRFTMALSSEGSTLVTNNGSDFSVAFPEGIHLPREAQNISLRVLSANIWNNNPNILGDEDLVFSDNGTPYSLNIPKGLYSLGDLNVTFSRLFYEANISPTFITLTADNATQKVVLNFEEANTIIDFTNSPTLANILGFFPVVQAASSGGEIRTAPRVAAFNQNNSWLVHCDLVNRGIPINNSFTQTIAIIPIEASPGSLYNYLPNNPLSVQAQNLAGTLVTNIRVWLTNEKGVYLDTLGETYTIVLEIDYFM